jgi:hypothetical protein
MDTLHVFSKNFIGGRRFLYTLRSEKGDEHFSFRRFFRNQDASNWKFKTSYQPKCINQVQTRSGCVLHDRGCVLLPGTEVHPVPFFACCCTNCGAQKVHQIVWIPDKIVSAGTNTLPLAYSGQRMWASPAIFDGGRLGPGDIRSRRNPRSPHPPNNLTTYWFTLECEH